MKINPDIFKTYDIRGIYGRDLNEETAYRLGYAYTELRQTESRKKRLRVVIGQDMRLSSTKLKRSLVKGLTEAGSEVIDIGLASTPTFYFAIAFFNYDGGIMVSASHNPKEWNGFKLTRAKAKPISADSGINILKEKVLANKFRPAKIKGKIIKRADTLEKQLEHDLKFVEINKIKPLKIVVDPANGMGAQYIGALFKHLPCQLIKMNFTLNGSFPAHEADPLKEENLHDLQKRVKAEKADLGIAIDGDGDRIFFIDDKGKTIDQSIIRGLLAAIFLREKPGSKICYDIRPGKITRDLIEKNGGIPIVTKVGHSLIKERMLKENAYFAGESSGHFFLNLTFGCFEMPNIMILKLLQEFSQIDAPVSEFIKPYQKYYHSGEINFTVRDKEAIFKKIEAKYKDGNINKLDGITVEYPSFWFNLRGSNTESKIRLNLEALTKKIMIEKTNELRLLIKQTKEVKRGKIR